jgi:hypothetical protein
MRRLPRRSSQISKSASRGAESARADRRSSQPSSGILRGTGDMREAQQGRTQGESEGEGAPRLLPSPAGLLAAPTQRAVGHRVLCAAI